MLNIIEPTNPTTQRASIYRLRVDSVGFAMPAGGATYESSLKDC
jgi:hypothetical protein